MITSLVPAPLVQANLFSGPELLIILVIVLLLFGGSKLPGLARAMGQAVRAFKDESNKLRSDAETETEEDNVKEPIKAQPSRAAKELDKPRVEQKS
jgi:sec-independent protein translocase protein TatA